LKVSDLGFLVDDVMIGVFFAFFDDGIAGYFLRF